MSLEELITKATAETNTTENWSVMIQLCEKVDRSESAAREAVNIISRRILHKNVNVVLFALTLSNALVQNCGITVHREISSRGFVDALVKQAANKAVHETVRMRILDFIQQWAAFFKNDPNLGFMVDTYNQLKSQGYPFPSPDKKPETVKTQRSINKQKEEEELQLAMALSLSAQDAKQTRVASPSKSAAKAICQVRALYDFAGLEEGELRLIRGDIVDVYDDTTFKDWWKGELRGKVGIFPSNYVERLVEGSDEVTKGATLTRAGEPDAAKIDEFTNLLMRIDPQRDNLSENERVQELYHALLLMRPKLIKEVETRHSAQEELRILADRFASASSTYHKLMEASLAAQRNAYQQQHYTAPTQYGPVYNTYPQPSYQPASQPYYPS